MKHPFRALAHGTLWPKALLALLLALGLSIKLAAGIVVLVVAPFLIRLVVSGRREQFREGTAAKRRRMLEADRLERTVYIETKENRGHH